MPWNEPGSNNQDPWGNKRRNQGGPPDLDEALKALGRKFSGLFGTGGSGSGSNKGGDGAAAGGLLVGAVAAVVIAIWWGVGWYTVNENERAVVLRFGKYVTTEEPGLHWYAPLFERVELVDISKVEQETIRGRMYTKDENLVDVGLGVQYRIADPVAYLFNVTDPRFTLAQAAESSLRLVIGESVMDDILTGGKDVIRATTQDEINKMLEPYKLGLEVTEVTLQETKAPDDVREAFDDYQNALQDAERYTNEANGYQREKIPLAEARAQSQLQDAEAYRSQEIAKATGEVQRFQKLLPQYLAAPEVTRDRLYIETMEEVFSKVSKVVVDVKQGNNIMYLPIDKINARRDGAATEAGAGK